MSLVNILTREKKEESQPHYHLRGQFVYIQSGILNIKTEGASWILPEGRLGWIPKRKVHSAQALYHVDAWTMFSSRKVEKILPDEICIIKATPLLLALLNRFVYPQSNDTREFTRNVQHLIWDELKIAEVEELKIILPKSPELLKIAESFLDNLSSVNNIDDWAKMAGKSKRTFTRHFLSETGMTFDQWKKNALNLKALELLAQGKQVSDIAIDLGYESVSAFISMFKKHFGDTPMKFFKKKTPPQTVRSKGEKKTKL